MNDAQFSCWTAQQYSGYFITAIQGLDKLKQTRWYYLASRNPVNAKYRVLGIGVAESVSTSTEVLNEAILSFCFTPNL